MPRRKPQTPTRREVIGDGIGGPLARPPPRPAPPSSFYEDEDSPLPTPAMPATPAAADSCAAAAAGASLGALNAPHTFTPATSLLDAEARERPPATGSRARAPVRVNVRKRLTKADSAPPTPPLPPSSIAPERERDDKEEEEKEEENGVYFQGTLHASVESEVVGGRGKRAGVEAEEEEEEEQEDEKEEEGYSGGETVGPRPCRKRRKGMNVDDTRGGHGHSSARANGDGRRVERSAVPGASVGGVIVRSFAVEANGSLRVVPGLCIVASKPPSTEKAALIRTSASGTEEESPESEEEDARNRTSRNWGIAVETIEGRSGAGGSTATRALVGMLRVVPEVVCALEDLNRDGFIAITTASVSASSECHPKEGRADDPLDEGIDARTYSHSGGAAAAATAAAVVGSGGGGGAGADASTSLSLDIRFLPPAFQQAGPRSVDVPKWQLLIGWLFPRAVEGFYRLPIAAEDDRTESPPTAAEILDALDTARSNCQDVLDAIQQGPENPVPDMPELQVDLRNHQKAAIRWMVDAETIGNVEASSFGTRRRQYDATATPVSGGGGAGGIGGDEGEGESSARRSQFGDAEPVSSGGGGSSSNGSGGDGEDDARRSQRRDAMPVSDGDVAGGKDDSNRRKSQSEGAKPVSGDRGGSTGSIGGRGSLFGDAKPVPSSVGVGSGGGGDGGGEDGLEGAGRGRLKGGATTERNARLLGWVSLDLAPRVQAAGVAAAAGGVAPIEFLKSAGGGTPARLCVSSSAREAPGEQVEGGMLDSRAPDDGVSERAVPEAAVPVAGVSGGAVPVGGVPPVGCRRLWFHVPSARLVAEVPGDWVTFAPVSGGILADEMGLGKTVEVIGCLMSNRWKPANDVPDSPPPEATRAGQDVPDLAGKVGDESAPLPAARTDSAYWDNLAPQEVSQACVCGRGDDEPLAPGDLCFVQCDSCGWWLHGGCCGFTPTGAGAGTEEVVEEEEGFTCVICSCLALLKDPKRCGSTLIICPHKIRAQWEGEIRARTKPGTLKVVVYPGVREILSSGGKAKAPSRQRRQAVKRRRSSSSSSGGGGAGKNTKRRQRRGPAAAVAAPHPRAAVGPSSSSSSSSGSSGSTETIGPEPQPQPHPDAATSLAAVASAVEEGKEGGGEGEDRVAIAASEVGAGLAPGRGSGGSGSGGGGGGGGSSHGNEGHQAGGESQDDRGRNRGGGESRKSGESRRDGDLGSSSSNNGSHDPFSLLSPETLASYDVVLTTFDVLRAEVHHVQSKFADLCGEGARAGRRGSGSSLRRKKRYRVVPSPLPALRWWRLVIDEAHMVESTTQETAKMALQIPAQHRWCVTGTPIGKGSVDDLYGLLVFLQAAPLDIKSVWAKTFREPIDRRLPGAMERLALVLKDVMWRVTKKAVAAQIDIPPQTDVDRRLRFSSVEAHFYQKQHRAACDDARSSLKGGRGTAETMFKSLLKLRQACCHPCIGTGGLGSGGGGGGTGGGSRLGSAGLAAGGGSQGRWLSMDQILDRLIDEERLKAEESQRKAILNLNASGAVSRLFLQAQERRLKTRGNGAERDDDGEDPEALVRESISCYQRALKMMEDNRTPGPVTGGAEVTGSVGMVPVFEIEHQQASAGVSGGGNGSVGSGGGGGGGGGATALTAAVATAVATAAATATTTAAATSAATSATTAATAAATSPTATASAPPPPTPAAAAAAAAAAAGHATGARLRPSSSPTSAAAAVLAELRKPLMLAWNVSFVPPPVEGKAAAINVNRATRDKVGQGGRGNGRRVDERSGSGVADPEVSSDSFGEGVGTFGKCTDAFVGHVGTSGTNTGEVGDSVGAVKGSGGVLPRDGSEGDAVERVVRRLRTPAWARLIFADRKRILQVRARASLAPAATAATANKNPARASDTRNGAREDEIMARRGEASSKALSGPGGDGAVVVATAQGTGKAVEDQGRGGSVWCPRQCVLQAATQGGNFADVVRFLLDVPALDVPTPPTTPPPPPPPPRPPLAAQVEALAHPHDGSGNGGEEGTQPATPDQEPITRDADQTPVQAGVGLGSRPAAKGQAESDSQGWLEVIVPPESSARGKEWRLVVETCQVVAADGGKSSGEREVLEGAVVALEFELREAEVNADDLQVLHSAHNLLEVLDMAKKRRSGAGDFSPEKALQLRKLVTCVKADYTATAMGSHHSFRLQLREAGRASQEALAASEKKRHGRVEWWEVALRYMENTANSRDFVRRAQLELLHEKAGQFGVTVRRSFPAFDSLPGLRIALAMKIKEAHSRRKVVLRKLESLTTDPGPMEIHTNSNCRRCRADWGKTGPVCGHCKIEDDIDLWEACVVYFRRPLRSTAGGGGGESSVFAQDAGMLGGDLESGPGLNNSHQGQTFKEESATLRLLRLIQVWIREQSRGRGPAAGWSGRGGAAAEDWAGLSSEGKDFLASWEASERELLSARALWRAHLDLLSKIDELESCVTPLRLAGETERLDVLTVDQRRMVLSAGVLNIRRREFELQRQAATHNLRVSKGQLAYLSTLVNERHASSRVKECAVCQENLIEEVAVVPCGHSFHPECIEFLLKVGNGYRFRCPTCRRSSSKSDVSLASTLDQSDGSTCGLPVKGSWGTKITALVGDILALGPLDKCLVFSQWDDMLDIVEQAFNENQVSYARMKGKKRSELALAAFRAEDGPRALMLPVKTGAHGLNLVEANHVFILEPLLNAAVEAQAVNRVHRGGQRRPTTIHRLVVLDTIEEDIARLREKKHSMLRAASGSPDGKRKASSKGKSKSNKSTRKQPSAMPETPDSPPSGRLAIGGRANGKGKQQQQQRTSGMPGSSSPRYTVSIYDDDDEDDEGTTMSGIISRRPSEMSGGGPGKTRDQEVDGAGVDEGREEEEPEEQEEEEEEDDGLPSLSSLTATSDEKQAFTLDDLKVLLCCPTGDTAVRDFT